MLVKFESEAGGFSMFGEIAVTLLKMKGHSGTVPSAILARDIPAALDRLQGRGCPAPITLPQKAGVWQDCRAARCIRVAAVALPAMAATLG